MQAVFLSMLCFENILQAWVDYCHEVFSILLQKRKFLLVTGYSLAMNQSKMTITESIRCRNYTQTTPDNISYHESLYFFYQKVTKTLKTQTPKPNPQAPFQRTLYSAPPIGWCAVWEAALDKLYQRRAID